MTFTFTASIVKEGKFYVARAIEFGVVSQGITIDEAKKNLREAVSLYLEDEPKELKNLSNNRSLLAVLDAEV